MWAVPKEGPVAFAAIAADGARSRSQGAQLREALEPQGGDGGDIPPFDLALAHELYRELLKPVEAGWRRPRA